MNQLGYRHVAFVPDGFESGGGMLLELESDWKISGGIEPNLNSARVSWREFAKLQDNPARTGTIEFWYSNPSPAVDPEGFGDPDHTLEKISIIDVEPLRAGFDEKSNWRWLEWRVVFADRRHLWKAPRGGMLNDGIINPDTAAPTMTLQDMIHTCLFVMGEELIELPDALMNAAPPIGVEWVAAHAPTELAKLLEGAPVVLVLKSDGSLAIERLGEGTIPQIPAGQVVRRMPWTGVERAGKTVVFVGDPVLEQEWHNYDPDAPLGIKFVAREADGVVGGALQWKWTRLDVAKAAAWVMGQYQPQTDQAAYNEQLKSETFRTLAVYGLPGGILRASIKGGILTRGRPEVWAKIAVKHPDGIWRNSDEWVNVPVLAIEDQSFNPLQPAIIHCLYRLGRVITETADADVTFVPLAKDELRVISVREVVDPATGAVQPTLIGFKQELGGPVRLTDEQAKLAMADSATILVPAPGWRLLREKNEDVNRAYLDAQAKKLGPERWIGGSGSPQATTWARGFAAAEISGRVSDIEYSQAEARTTIHENRWYLPHGRYLVKAGKKGSGGGGQQQLREQIGAVGGRDAMMMVGTGAGAAPTGGAQETIWAVLGEQNQAKPLCYAWVEARPNLAQTTMPALAGGRTGTADKSPAVDYISQNQQALTGKTVLMRRVLRPTNEAGTEFADEWAILPQPLSGAGGGATSQWFWIDVAAGSTAEVVLSDDDWRGRPLTIRAWMVGNSTPLQAKTAGWTACTYVNPEMYTTYQGLMMVGEDFVVGYPPQQVRVVYPFYGYGYLTIGDGGSLVYYHTVAPSFRIQVALNLEAGELLEGPTHQV